MNHLFWMELRRSLLQMRRYPVETALSFLILAGMFFGIAYGSDAAFGSTVPAGRVASLTVVSFIGWMLCMNLLSGPAAELEAEAQSGTVEQLFTGGLTLTRILLARMAAGIVITGGIVASIVLLAGRLTELDVSAAALLSLGLAIVTAAGGGFLLAGFALRFKKTRALVLLATFGLMPVMMADGSAAWITQTPAMLVLPFVGPMGLAKAALLDPAAWSWATFGAVAAASVAYFLIGLFLFGRLRSRAMRLGTIGQY
jgi:ABC-2 type transport system permease protein